MFIGPDHLKVATGSGLVAACAFIFYYGLTHAGVDGVPFAFPVFRPGNLVILLSAPVAQCAFYVLARRTSWLLNLFLVISVLCCVFGGLDLVNEGGSPGYRFTYWHQGDLLCVRGCNDPLVFGCLVFMQGCILIFSSSPYEGIGGAWRGVIRLVLVAALLWLLLTSFVRLLAIG